MLAIISGRTKRIIWDVLKYVRTDSRVLAVAKRDTDVVITLNEQARSHVDEIIGLVDVTGAEKFYKVKSVELKDIIRLLMAKQKK